MTDTVSFSMGIMSVPERRTMRKGLIDRLGGPSGMKAATVSHMVAIDFPRDGAWATAKRVWEAADPAASHHLLLQDDAYPVDDFWSVLRAVVTAAPDRIIALYSGRVVSKRAHARGEHFMHVQGISGTGLVMPVPMVREFLAWEEAMCPPNVPHDDIRVELFAFSTGKEPITTVPSIVDHRDGGKSVLGHSNATASVFEEDIARRRDVWVVPDEMDRGSGRTPLVNDALKWLEKGTLVWPPAGRWKT